MGRWRQISDVSRSARRWHFARSNQRAPKKNNSRSSDISGQCESASRRTCKWRSRHPSRQGYFRQRCSHGMSRQDKSSIFHMARASPERRYSKLWKEKQWAMKIEIRCGNAGCVRQLDEDQQKRRCASTGSFDRSLETDQQTKMTSRCKLWSEYGNSSTAWYLDGLEGFQKDLYQGEEKKGRHPPAFLWHMGNRLHSETECRKVHAGEVSEWQKNPMTAKETIGDGGCRKYANSQFTDQNRQEAIAVQNSATGPRWEHWWSGGWNTRSHQQCRLRRNDNNS